MSRWLINAFPLWALILMFVGGTTGLAIIGCVLLRRRYPALADGDHREVAGVVIGIFGAIYGIVLAFVIVVLWERYQHAEGLISEESAALSQMVRSVRGLPPDQEFALREAIQGYVQAVVEDEWTSMRTGDLSARTAASIDNIYATMQLYEPGTEAESVFYEAAADTLNEVTSSRRARLQASRESLPGLFEALVIGGAVIVVGMTLLLDVRSQALHLTFVGTVAGLVGFNLLLVLVMDHPFAGDLAVSERPFREEALAQFWAVKDAPAAHFADYVEVTAPEMAGVWNSNDFGVIVFRSSGDEVRGSYRYDNGTIVGRVSDGVFSGWWCEAPSRAAPKQAGDVEFRLARTGEGIVLDGRWRYGTDGDYNESWDMVKVDLSEPSDLAVRYDDPSAFCPHP